VGAPAIGSGPQQPERVGRYEILLPIASGGMATVYVARAVGLSGFTTDVALKLTHAHLQQLPEFATDLLEEAKLAARIRHRNVVAVMDVGDDPHGIYLVMEYVEGDSLAGLLRQDRSIPWPIATRMLLDALDGLHAAHELRDDAQELLGVVHRDFTPHNILVGLDGVARLADFGIAKAATRLGHTRLGMVKGKIAYMSPEQAHGHVLDRRCDVWAAGVVAWELFAGRRLYPYDDDVATLLKVATEAPPPLRTVAPETPAALEEAVASALVMKRDDRCPTALALARQISAAVRADGDIADANEVAEWMVARVGAKVSDRRMQAAEIHAKRARTGSVRRVEASLRETVPDPGATRVERSQSASVRTSTGSDPLPTAATTARESTALLPTRVQAEVDAVKHTESVAVVGESLVRPRRARSRKTVVGVLIALAGAAVLWATIARLPSSTHEPASVAPATPAVTAASPAQGTSPGTAVAAPAPRRTSLYLHANAPIASLGLAGRGILLDRPATEMTVGLEEAERDVPLRIEAVSSDGRHATADLPADVKDVALHFPVVSVGPRPAAPRAVPPPPAPGAPLAPSPYH
jgi:eukaryotic-like serine/threonine-protein kinase